MCLGGMAGLAGAKKLGMGDGAAAAVSPIGALGLALAKKKPSAPAVSVAPDTMIK